MYTEPHLVVVFAGVELQRKRWHAVGRPVVKARDDVLNPQSGFVCRPSRQNIRHDHARLGTEPESGNERRRQGLYADADFTPRKMAVFSDPRVGGADDGTWN